MLAAGARSEELVRLAGQMHTEGSLILASPSSKSRGAPNKGFKKSLASCKALATAKKLAGDGIGIARARRITMQVGARISLVSCERTPHELHEPRLWL